MSLVPRSCPYCASTRFDPWLDGVTDRLHVAEGTWSFLRCHDCGSAVLHPAPAAAELAALYPEVYSFHPGVARGGRLKKVAARLEDRLFFRPQYEAQFRVIRRVTGPASGSRLLDVGCGVGQRLQAFRGMGYDVHGLDFLPAVVEHLREELEIPATCGDLGDLDDLFQPASFDVVTAFQVVEHSPDARALLASCLRLLRPGGWFVATIPMGDSLQAAWLGARWCGVREAPRHLNLPSREGLRRLCRELGFTRLEIHPDSLLSCAGLVGLSLLPDAATTTVYSRSSVGAVASRVLAAGVTLASLPLCFIENRIVKRPATAIVLAQR